MRTRAAGDWLREPRWIALATSFVMVVLVQGVSYSFSVFLLPLSSDLGGLRGVAAGAYSLHNLAVGLVATVVDRVMERFGERAILTVGALVLGAGIGFAGTASSALELLVWFGAVAGIGAGLLGSVAQTVMLSRWFPTARGTVNGIALSGMGLGIFLFAPLSGVLIERVGWRLAFGALGVGTALLLLPAAALTPPRPPEPPRTVAPGSEPARDERLGSILVTARFWCFAAAFFLTPVSNFMVTTHQVAHLVEAGLDARSAAAAFGLVGLLSAVGRIAFGALSDRWDRVPTALLTYAATAGGTFALLLIAPGAPGWLLWAFILPFGLTLGARGPIVAALTADVYRGRSFGAVLGLITFGNRLGSAIGPWLGGVLHDLTGSYRAAFAASVVALVLAATSFWAAGRGGPRSGKG